MVIKGYKSKGSLFATASVNHDFNHFSFPIPFKIISQVMFFLSSLMPPKEIFFTVKWAPGLWESSLETALWFHNSSVHLVWPCIHGHIHLLHRGVCDKPKASGALGVWIPHYHNLWAFPIAQNGLLRLASVVSKLSPPMKSFHSCSGSLGDLDLDMMVVERGRLQWCFRGGIHGQKGVT